MEFGAPQNSYFLLLCVVVIVVSIIGVKKKEKITTLFNLKTVAWQQGLKLFFMALGILCISISLLAPRVFTGKTTVITKSLNIYFLMDTSKSMLATDVKPNRIGVEKSSISQILNHLNGDKVGFIPFASSAYIQMPLTDDFDMAKLFLDSVDTDLMAGGGTNIKEALALANSSFDKTYSGDRVIVIFTDGEEHNQEAIDYAKTMKNTKIYTVGIGSESGSLIPLDNGQYLKDEQGHYVNTKLNVETLKTLAKEGHGHYYSSSASDIKRLASQLSTLKKGNGKDLEKQYKELYQIPLLIGVVLLLISLAIRVRRRYEA